MAKYCRYCKEKMRNPRDKFCYKCRKAGNPVDYFYRFARKVNLSEDEKDNLRDLGMNLFFSALFIALICIGILAVSYSLIYYGTEKVSVLLLVVFFLILALSVWLGITGFKLIMLNQKAVNKNWKISIIMSFCAAFRSNRRGAALISAILTAPKKIARERALKADLKKLSSQETTETEEKRSSEHENQLPENKWICSFCGYVNTSERIDCKSCGKTR